MRIIIFTDSLGRPRPDLLDNQKTVYEDVYGYRIKKYFEDKNEVELIYIESLDSIDAIHWSKRMVAFRCPDLVIFHLGINDCVPRLFKKNSKSIILNSFFRQFTFNFIFKTMVYFRYLITRLRPLVYVQEKEFSENFLIMIDEIKKYNNRCQFMCISIAKSDLNDKKSFNYNQNVDNYNQILKSIFLKNYIEINTIMSNKGLISDNVHLSKESHKELFVVVKDAIEGLL